MEWTNTVFMEGLNSFQFITKYSRRDAVRDKRISWNIISKIQSTKLQLTRTNHCYSRYWSTCVNWLRESGNHLGIFWLDWDVPLISGGDQLNSNPCVIEIMQHDIAHVIIEIRSFLEAWQVNLLDGTHQMFRHFSGVMTSKWDAETPPGPYRAECHKRRSLRRPGFRELHQQMVKLIWLGWSSSLLFSVFPFYCEWFRSGWIGTTQKCSCNLDTLRPDCRATKVQSKRVWVWGRSNAKGLHQI